MIGKTISNYKVTSELGKGGMGEVYLAEDTRLGRKVAIKRVRPEALGSDEAIARFLFEARAIAPIAATVLRRRRTNLRIR